MRGEESQKEAVALGKEAKVFKDNSNFLFGIRFLFHVGEIRGKQITASVDFLPSGSLVSLPG